jgi:hypothetical protein
MSFLQRTAIGFLVLVPLALVTYYFGQRSVIDAGLAYYPADFSGARATQAELDALQCFLTIYVPAYSHIYWEEGRGVLLSVTLSIRNTSPDDEVVVTFGGYYDTEGQILTEEDKPTVLEPLQTATHLVKASDERGGAGANFIVRAGSSKPQAPKLLAEAIMIGKTASGTIAFARSGVAVESNCE